MRDWRTSAFALPIALAGLAITGTFQSADASTAWPLKVSSDGRHLADQNDTPFLYTADTSWTMLSMLSVADAKKYIDLREAQGFNAIQTVATGWRRNGSGSRGVFFEDGDVTRPNEDYFAGVDEIVGFDTLHLPGYSPRLPTHTDKTHPRRGACL